MMNDTELIQKAVDVAYEVHDGQKDKGGMPYVMHPLRVAERCSTTEEKVVAILHDTIEDGGITPQDLLCDGFSHRIVEAVLSVTKREGEDYEAFVKRAAVNPIGRMVKLHDIEDNMDIRRLPELDMEALLRLLKYHKAYKYLMEIISVS